MAESQVIEPEKNGKENNPVEEAVEKRGRGRPKKKQTEMGNLVSGGGEDASPRGEPASDSPDTGKVEKIKSDESKPSATKECKIMLPLKRNEYSVPSHSSDGGSRDPSAPKGKDVPAAERKGGQGDASKEEAQDASSELQKKKGRGRPRKNAFNGNQQKGSVGATSDETVTSVSATQKNSEKAAEPGSSAHSVEASDLGQGVKASESGLGVEALDSGLGVEASDSGLGVEASDSGLGVKASDSGLGVKASDSGLDIEASQLGSGVQVQNTVKPLEEVSQQADEQSKVSLDEATNVCSESESTKKKGRGRPRKNPIITKGPPAGSIDVAPTDSVDVTAMTESVQATAPLDSVQANALSDSVQAAVPTDSVQAAASSTELMNTASLQSASEVDNVENVAPQPEPPKKRGRGRPPRKTPVITHPTSPPVEETKESDTGANPDPSDSTECEPPEKKVKPEETRDTDLVGGSDAVSNSSVRLLQKEGQGEPHQSPLETAQLESPPEGSKAPAILEDVLANASEGKSPEKEAEEEDDPVKDSSMANVSSKSPQKRGRGRPRKNVASTTETAAQPPERDNEEGVEYNSMDASVEEPKQKRGRGRPPGSKRGRGRPRKNPTVTPSS